MFKDPENNYRPSIRRGATAKLIRTCDQKLRIIVFTGNDGFLGKGAQGKCFLGILKSQQHSERQILFDEEQVKEDQVEQLLSSSQKYPLVVVKQIIRDPRKPNQQELYKKEIENLSLATKVPGQNDNLVKCYPYILTSEKHFYMVMQYCQGKSLDLLINRRLNENKWFNFFQFLKIFRDIANGYYPLNKVTIMHEDLKPENIFIKGKNFKIGDFGLSFLMRSEKGFMRGGTQSYNGIQKYQKNQPSPSHKSDLYSLGVILFKLFYGIHPYYEKRELQQFKVKQIQKKAIQRNQTRDRVRINRWEQFQIFVKFYQERELKQRPPYVSKPHLKGQFDNKYGTIIESLYTQKIPQLLRKLVQKDINNRPTFTDVFMLIKQSKVQQILKQVEQNDKKKSHMKISFFQDLQETSIDYVTQSLRFTRLGKKIIFEDESQIQKQLAQVPHHILQTASSMGQKKQELVRKYPRIFQFKEMFGQINSLTKMLIDTQQQLSQFNFKQFISLLRKSTDTQQLKKDPQVQQDEGEILFYEDKKMQVEFVVQKYLLSYLSHVIDEAQRQIKQFNQIELELFYKENVDLLLQIVEKNRNFLQSELFLTETDYQDFKKCQNDFEKIIIGELISNITLGKCNLLFVYYCLVIVAIKQELSEKKKSLSQQKSQRTISLSNPKDDTQLEFLLVEKHKVKKILSRKSTQIPDALLKQIEQTIIKQLDKRNIKYLISFDE